MGLTQYDEKIPIYQTGYIDSSNGTNVWDLCTLYGTPAFRVDVLTAVTDSAVPLLLDVGAYDVAVGSATFYKIETVTIPASAGDGTVPAFDILAALPVGYQTGFALQAGLNLAGKLHTALVAGKTLLPTAVGGLL